MNRYFDTEEAIEAELENLPEARCLWCRAKGTLAGHDSLWRHGGKPYGLRGKRVYCDPNSIRGKGCGRTITLWLSKTLWGRCLGAMALMRFILKLLSGTSM